MHRFKNNNGLHTNDSLLGRTWNVEWKIFRDNNPDASRISTIGQLKRMEKIVGIEKYRAVKQK